MKKLTKEIFIKRSKILHCDKYDYSLVDYKNMYTIIKIICPIHGIFKKSTVKHLNGSGCNKCKQTKGEKQVSLFLENNNIKLIRIKYNEDINKILLKKN
jgi:hypothetical protein